MPHRRSHPRTKWTLPFPAKRTIADKPDEWVEQALEGNRNAVAATARAIGIDDRDLKADMRRRGMRVPVSDKLRGSLPTLTADEARRLYESNDRNLFDTARMLGVCCSTLKRAMRRFGIPILRGMRHWDPKAETLRRLYWDEGKTTKQIGEMFGFSCRAVISKMKALGVPRRPKNPKWSEWSPEACARRIERSAAARWRKPCAM